MQIEKLKIPEVMLITPKRHSDSRGFFSESYNERELAENGILLNFVQDNHSLSVEKGTVRGLHFQIPPSAQHKLVRVVRGSVLDVAVDIREGSPTYGQHVSAVISAEAGNQILVPVGFAHGFCTLEPNTELLYKVTDYYSGEHDRGIRWNDPALGIDWAVDESEASLSDRDLQWPILQDLPTYFSYHVTA
jgi:dTDP-4-dehydrorhamnose 3,5-epimerase